MKKSPPYISLISVISLILLIHTIPIRAHTPGDDPTEITRIHLPLQFIANAGQWDAAVQYGIIRGMDKAAFTRDGVQLFRPLQRPTALALTELPSFQSAVGARRTLETSSLRFVNPSPNMRIEALENTGTTTNFYSGSDSSRWRSNVPSFAGLRYANVWEGIDVEYEEDGGRLLQRIVVHEGADAEKIAFTTNNIAAHDLSVNGYQSSGTIPTADPGDGNTGIPLRILGDTLRPVPYRTFFERRRVIETEFNTYFGGSGNELVVGFDMDSLGRIYMHMLTNSTDLPIQHGMQDRNNGGQFNLDYYISCLREDGKQLRFGTYLGGSNDEMGYPTYKSSSTAYVISNYLAIGNDHSTHVLANTQSTDFPVTTNAVQVQRYNTTAIRKRNCATSLVRLDTLGRLDAATWLGGPTWFGGSDLKTGPDGSVYVMGLTSGQQWFVTKGSVQDTLMNGLNDDYEAALVIARISPHLDSIIAGTYFFAPDGIADTTIRTVDPYLFMEVDHLGSVVLGGYRNRSPLPLVNEWMDEGSAFVTKMTPDLSRYIFSTKIVADTDYVYQTNVRSQIDHEGNIYVYGVSHDVNVPTVNPLPGSDPSARTFLIKFRPDGGIPVYSTYIPWNIEWQNNPVMIHANTCGELLLFSPVSKNSQVPFMKAEDTTRPGYRTHYMLRLDSLGRSITYGSYWHVDDSYLGVDGTWVMSETANTVLTWDMSSIFSAMGRDNNLVFVAGGVDTPSDRFVPLHAFQGHMNSTQDLAIIRTRVPGCEILSCLMDMPDTLFRPSWPGTVTPEYFPVTVEVRNIDPSRTARDIECVLTLPPGLLPDPASQPLRQSLGSQLLHPGESATFTWQLRVDTAQLRGDGLWIDAVTYYRNADYTFSGPPASSPCAYYISIAHPEPEFTCTLTAPDSLTPHATGDAYTPAPFPVHFELRNTGSIPFPLSRVGLFFGDGMGADPVPVSTRYITGGVINPGQTFTADWQADVHRLPTSRRVRCFVQGWDEGNRAITFCEQEIIVPPLDPLRCEVRSPIELRYNPRSGMTEPTDILASLQLRHVIDTLLADVTIIADASALRFLALKPGVAPMRQIAQMLQGVTHKPEWPLELVLPPTVDESDTIRYHITANGGRWTRECEQVFTIRIIDSYLSCTADLPSAITAAEVESRGIVTLDYTLSNVGTVPVDVDRLELAITPLNIGLKALDPATRTAGQLNSGGTLPWSVRLQASILRAARNATCTVTAFGKNTSGGDTVLSVCDATIAIEGIDGLRCAIGATDSVLFERDSLHYIPDPLPLQLDLSNILDTEETAIEAEIDLTSAPRFELAAGESALKTLSRIDSHATAAITWLLAPQAGPTDETQDIRIRYRSMEQGVWKECITSIIIEAWPEIAEVRCATGGHDSLHADAKYEAIIPQPLQVSYTATNSGTVTLTNCAAAIILPAGFALAGSDSIQRFGNLAPGETAKRWWTLSTTDQLSAFGPYAFNWQWTSDEQGTVTGCAHTVQFVPVAPGGIVFTPLRLYFEAEMGGTLPAAQYIHLWTGNGLSMPWTAQSDAWYLDLDPVIGDHAATIAVRPNTTILNKGMHAGAIELAGSAQNLPKRIEVDYLITSLTGTASPPSPSLLSLGPLYPHPIPLQGEARIIITSTSGSTVRITLHDLLGRERAMLHEGVITDSEILILHPVALGLQPGSYLLRLLSPGGIQSRMVTVVR